MKLSRVKIRNFRCYKNEIKVDFEDMTALVGRNDAGKSTLMDALDAFFNDKGLDKNDASKGGNPKDVAITCVFRDLPELMVIDDKAETSLKKEFLLNENGELEIEKIYNCSVEKAKVTEINVKARHPVDHRLQDLLELKIDQLKARANEVGADLTGVDLKVKAEIRSAIRKQIGETDLRLTKIVLCPDSNEKHNGEVVWSGLKNLLPTFALFKSDRQSSDQDAEAQDPLKIAVKDAISGRLAELDTIFDHVEKEVKKVADLTLKKLREMDSAIASTLTPKFDKVDWAKQFKVSITGDEDIPLNKRGSGVRRMILLNFFRAKAEQTARERLSGTTIYAIEEPETSQHPHNQRLMMRALQSLAGDDQIIITTHTPMLARYLPTSSLRFIKSDENGERSLLAGGTEIVNKEIAKSLGVLPDHSVKLFIAVEGVHDIAFLKNIATVFKREGMAVPDLDSLELSGEVIFVPAGGAENLAFWSNRLEVFNRPEFHLFDRDSPSGVAPKHSEKAKEINKREGCFAAIAKKLEIENYIHKDAINAGLAQRGYQLVLSDNFDGDADVPNLLAAQINAVAPKSDRWKDGRVKKWFANEVVLLMDARMIQEIDTHGEMYSWLSKMNEMLEAVPA